MAVYWEELILRHFITIFVSLVIHCEAQHYTNQWAVHIHGGHEVAMQLADRHGFIYIGKIMPDFYNFKHQRVSKRSVFASDHLHSRLATEPEVKWVEQQVSKKRVKRDAALNLFNDPMWPRMWYMHRDGNLDMNVADVYVKWKISGRGSVVSILDDGIEKDHPDLVQNYDAGASYDVNDHDSDPQPRYDISNENRHGTRCAGEVAAAADNKICSTGIAYGASIGGVRMLDGEVTDAVEAQSISLNPQHIDIYSASWGPDDDGRTVDGPGPLARMAFLDGITKGRRGLGSIYVWASGNGGRNGDSCSCDGYTNSIYTLSISSASENGLVPWYSEACASTLATTYSSGSLSERQILTTDLHHSCTENHTGTSASAPLAAGICALALEANRDLTWRDMQYLVVLTARQANLQADDWVINGIGRKVSHHYGFGLMNAAAMVELALNWTHLPEQHRCQVLSQDPSRNLPANAVADFTIEADRCEENTDAVHSLEHVQVSITLSASRRGEVELSLTSPSGTRSVLLARRAADTSYEGLTDWVMMTTHSWGERPSGTWTLTVRTGATTALVSAWSLIIYGTAETPAVLTRYLSAVSAHPSVTQTRQVAIVDAEASLVQPPDTTLAAATASSLSSSLVSELTPVSNVSAITTSSSYSITTSPASVSTGLTSCDMGRALLEDRCYQVCPEGYYLYNQTHVPVNASSEKDAVQHSGTVLICHKCISTAGVCQDLRSRLGLLAGILVAAGAVCIALAAVVIWCLRRRFAGKSSTDYGVLRYHKPRSSRLDIEELKNGKHLLSSDSELSEEEVEIVPTVGAEHGGKLAAS